MYKIFIKIRKCIYIKPKWKFLRISNKVIKKRNLIELRNELEIKIKEVNNQLDKSYLEGQISIIDYLLK